jgi:hypothetical protein
MGLFDSIEVGNLNLSNPIIIGAIIVIILILLWYFGKLSLGSFGKKFGGKKKSKNDNYSLEDDINEVYALQDKAVEMLNGSR